MSEPDESESASEPTYDPVRARNEKSLGPMSDKHWSRTRKDLNAEEIEFLRERSNAPGVAEGGADRNHYCMNCHGVIPLSYDQREPADRKQLEHCPHCGTELDSNVRMMFNWVEMDQPHGSDARALLPYILATIAAFIVVAIVTLFLVLG